VNTKYAAKLKFLLDESFDEGSHIDRLLRDPKVAQDLAADDGKGEAADS
ncbi:MAG TPA: ribosome-binding factor A, partial [Allosphingosinicella sp.]|nr:ribosome-binding factor A [Allosphingosinicella sp.]